MNERTANESVGVNDISKYIDGLKFKNAVIGGVDKEEVFISIREIYNMFIQVYDSLNRQLQQERTDAGQLQTALKTARSDASGKTERLEKQIKAEYEAQNAEKLEKLRADYEENLKTALVKAKTDAAERSEGELNKIKRQLEEKNKELYDLNARLKNQPDASGAESVEELKEQKARCEKAFAALTEKLKASEAEAKAREAELSAMLDAAELDINERQNRETQLNTELNTLKGQIAVKESEIKRQESEYQRELELAKSGSAARGETLEEIYIEARAVRERAVAAAKQEADEILACASGEADKIEKENSENLDKAQAEAQKILSDAQESADRLCSDAQESADKLYSDAKESADKIEAEAKTRGEENDSRCSGLLAEAEKTVNDANTKAAEIVAAARQDYRREREKYNAHLSRLSELRTKTVGEVQGTVQKLSELIFDMSLLGIRTDAVNSAELTLLDGDVHDAESGEAADARDISGAAVETMKELNDEPKSDAPGQ